MDIKSSDFILILKLEDINGQKMRVADTAEFTVRVWTNDPTHYLTFKKRDIISDEYNDRIPIDRMQMECLASGTIIYDYDYSKWNADFSATDEKYNKVKTVVTDVYWRNVMNPGNPCNVINYQTIEHIYDLIEKERVEREKLGYYIENEYTNKLADEVKRSTDVDIEMYKTIKGNKELCDNRTSDLTNKLNDEIVRAKAKEELIDGKITDEIARAKQVEGDITSSLQQLKTTVKTKDDAHDESIKNIDARLTVEVSRATAKDEATDNRLATIEGDSTVIGSIAHSLSEAKHYTDDAVAKVKSDLDVSGFATKSEIADVKATISTKADKTDVYTKAEVDEKIANFDGNVSLDGYAKTVDVDKKIADVKADTATELGKKLDKTTYATDKLSFADKTETNNAITTVSDNLTAETSRATGVEDGIKADVALKANSADVYTTAQVDEKLNTKANSADVNTSLDKKLDKSTYTTDKATYALKSDVATELDKKANSTDVTTELNKKANSSDVYTTAQVDEKVNVKANAADVYTQEQCDAKYMKMWQGSQSEYDAIDPRDNNTLYVIK